MKVNFLRILMLVTLFNSNSLICFAQDESVWKWSGSIDVLTRYIGCVAGSTNSTKSVLQPSLTLYHGNFHANVFMSMHDPARFREGDELDISVGYAWFVGKVKNDMTFYYYDLYPLSALRGDLFAISDTMSFPKFAGWNSSLVLEYDIPTDKELLPGGFFYKADVYREFSVKEKMIIGSIAVGGHDGAFGLKPEVISFVRGTLSLPIPIKSVVISPSIMLQWGAKEGGIADNQTVLGISMAW